VLLSLLLCWRCVDRADLTNRIRKFLLTEHSIESLGGGGDDAAGISHFLISVTMSGKYWGWAATGIFFFGWGGNDHRVTKLISATRSILAKIGDSEEEAAYFGRP